MIKFGDVKITPAIAVSQYNRQDGVKTTDGTQEAQPGNGRAAVRL